jgi:hypothetical protein
MTLLPVAAAAWVAWAAWAAWTCDVLRLSTAQARKKGRSDAAFFSSGPPQVGATLRVQISLELTIFGNPVAIQTEFCRVATGLCHSGVN